MRRALKALGTTFAAAALLAMFAPGPASAQTGVQVDWVRRYTSGNDPEFAFANAVAVDDSGNVYVTGSSYGPNGLPDYATVKYSSSGDTLWVQRYNGPANNWDGATELALDASGNVYVTGQSYGSNDFDYVTVKYDASGVQKWTARYNALYDYATALAVDAAGNVYVTGYSYGSGTYYDYATIKYTTRGKPRWLARYNSGIDDYAYALAVDASGN